MALFGILLADYLITAVSTLALVYNKPMFDLPLFPLNTVLFPGMPMPLRIFEKRYKKMVSLCLQEKRPFGVVFIREGVAERGPLARPHLVGCTAHILQTQPLANDQMIIMTVGKDRFRIQKLNYEQAFLVGTVELAPLIEEPSLAVTKAAGRLYPIVVEYLAHLSDLGEIEFDPNELTHDPEQLSYLAATFLQVPQIQKQKLLERDRPLQLLADLSQAYSREVALMRYMPKSDQGGFSVN